MLEILGVGYLTGSMTAVINIRKKAEAYRVYVTDCLYMLSAFVGNPMPHRYYDILHPNPEDTRSASEITRDRLESFGIKVVG